MPNTSPLISVVITNYNYGQFIAQAIDSVLAQSYPSIEVIVVDDGSTDDSDKVIRAYGNKVAYITQPNSGVVVARNVGAAQAKGQYICFVDADDTLDKDYIKILLAALSQTDKSVAFAYPDFRFFGQTEAVVKALPWNPRKLLYRNYVVLSALIKTSAFRQIGGFSSNLNTKISFEDWDLWLKFTEQDFSGIYIPEVLFNYRLHGNGRNGPALKQRAQVEADLRQQHPKLYGNLTNQLYLTIFQTASRLRNLIKPAAGN